MGGYFVGRIGELAALAAAWQAAEADEAAPGVAGYGEPGIGKTRMVGELGRVAREHGTEVLWGNCYEGGDAHPYAVWTEAVRGYVDRVGAERIGTALGGDVRWLAPVLP